MAITKLGRQVRRSYQSCGFIVKLSAVVVLGLCFVLVWSVFSNFSVTSQRETFDDISVPMVSGKVDGFRAHSDRIEPEKGGGRETHKESSKSGLEKSNGSPPLKPKKRKENARASEDSKGGKGKQVDESVGAEGKEEVIKEIVEDEKEDLDSDGNASDEREGDSDMINPDDLDQEVIEEEESSPVRKNKKLGPLFDPKAKYAWKHCSTRSKHNYIPCIDMETATGRLQSYRHRERSCPRSAVMCLVPLPHDGYVSQVHWPESKTKILYKNVAHPKLAAFVKTQDWLVESGEYLTFPQNQSVFKGGVQHYLESIEELVPDIEWGKNIHIVLDIGCKDSSFGAYLLEKDVLTFTLGLKDDLVDLTQVGLERGFPAIVTPFATRRLPFPSGVFDAIHCGDCGIPWHSNGGKLIVEMNRILRPGGYFILSTKHNSIEADEALTTLMASICWNILADKTDDVSDILAKIYQKPESNDMYKLRRKKVPPLCKENDKPDVAWTYGNCPVLPLPFSFLQYPQMKLKKSKPKLSITIAVVRYVPLKTCLHTIPEAIEERGNEWPTEWPMRLHTFPEWMNNKEKLIADSAHWKAIVNNSYHIGLGIDWSTIRNVMDMKSVNGGFAAALSDQKVWVMNVVPVHAPDTLPIIFERGLIGAYHDWCESFGTYPRSYDLLHADHLFSRLKNRCKQPAVIIVEMDRILRPGGWAIIRDKVEILNPVEAILRSLHWDIRLTFAQNNEGILCAQKTTWRP